LTPPLARGSVVLLGLDPTLGHEQRGVRPCVVVSATEVGLEQRYPMLGIVPITGTRGEGALYPELSAGASGLTKTSYALVDHVRSVDKRRVLKTFGTLRTAEIAAIDQGLQLFFGLPAGT
jgi:mRNA interferase MazF